MIDSGKCICTRSYADPRFDFVEGQVYEYKICNPVVGFSILRKFNNTVIIEDSQFGRYIFDLYFIDFAEIRQERINNILDE